MNWRDDNILHTTEVYEDSIIKDVSPTEYLLKSKEILLPIDACTYYSIMNNRSWCIDKENPLNIKEAHIFVDGFLSAWGEIKENTRHGLWHNDGYIEILEKWSFNFSNSGGTSMKIKSYLPRIYDAIAALFLVIAMGIVSLIFWVLLALYTYNEERGVSKSVHQGKVKAYKDGKREGKWNITSTYLLDNGNDGKTSAEGFYAQGVKDGTWKVRTPYQQCLYEYDKGVVREAICLNTSDFTYYIFDEWGNLIESKEGSREECERLYRHFGYYYGRSLCTQ